MDEYDVGRRIARLRRENTMTQKELARRLNVSVWNVRKWEKGIVYPDLYVLPRLSGVLDASVTDILGFYYISNERAVSEILEMAEEERIRRTKQMRHRTADIMTLESFVVIFILRLCWVLWDNGLFKEEKITVVSLLFFTVLLMGYLLNIGDKIIAMMEDFHKDN